MTYEVRTIRYVVNFRERENETLELAVFPKPVDLPVLGICLCEAFDFLDHRIAEERIVFVGRDDHVHILLLDCAFQFEFLIDPDVLIVGVEVEKRLVSGSDEKLEEILSGEFVRLVAVKDIAARSPSFLRIIDSDEFNDPLSALVGLFGLVHIDELPEIVFVQKEIKIPLHRFGESGGKLSDDRESPVFEYAGFIELPSNEPEEKEANQ